MIDLTRWIGTYNPLVNDDGTYVDGLAGLDWAYIGRLLVLLIVVSITLSLLVNIVKGVFRNR